MYKLIALLGSLMSSGLLNTLLRVELAGTTLKMLQCRHTFGMINLLNLNSLRGKDLALAKTLCSIDGRLAHTSKKTTKYLHT